MKLGIGDTKKTTSGGQDTKESRPSENSQEPTTEEATVGAIVSRIWRQLIFVLIESFAGSANGLIFFFFLRTTIDCGDNTPDDFDRDSNEWSGSRYCNDRCKVAKETTLVSGIAYGFEQGAQLFCLPVAGVLSDVLGRKIPFTINFGGFAASMFLLAAAAFVRKGSTVVGLVLLSSIVKGMTDSFFVVLNASVTDVFRTVKARGFVFGNLTVCRFIGGGLTVGILSWAVISANTYDYGPSYLSFAAILLVATIAVPLVMRETNTSPSRAMGCEKMSPLYAMRVLKEDPIVRYIGILVFFVVGSVSVTTIANAYVIGAYGYTQIESIYIVIVVGFLAFLAACLAPWMIRRFGNRFTLRVSLVSAFIGLCILCFSPIAQIFFFGGIAFLALSVMGVPAYQALLSKNIVMTKMGSTMGAVGTIGILATAVFSPTYAAVFHAVGSGGDCEEETNLSLAWIPWGMAAVLMGAANFTLDSWFNAYPEKAAGEMTIAMRSSPLCE